MMINNVVDWSKAAVDDSWKQEKGKNIIQGGLVEENDQVLVVRIILQV